MNQNPSAGECDQCGERFKNQHQLKRHKYQRHDLKEKVKCDICEKMFPNIFSKEIHNKRIHLREKNFSCKKCYYRGFDVSDLKYHTMNKHSNEKPHKCATCPMAFKRVSGLYQHSKTHANAHSDAKDFQCELCGKKFRLKSSSDRCVAKHKGYMEPFLVQLKAVVEFLNTFSLTKAMCEEFISQRTIFSHVINVTNLSRQIVI